MLHMHVRAQAHMIHASYTHTHTHTHANREREGSDLSTLRSQHSWREPPLLIDWQLTKQSCFV